MLPCGLIPWLGAKIVVFTGTVIFCESDNSRDLSVS